MVDVKDIIALFGKNMTLEQRTAISTSCSCALWEHVDDADDQIAFLKEENTRICEAYSISQLLIPLHQRRPFLPRVELKRLAHSGVIQEIQTTRVSKINTCNLVAVDCLVFRFLFSDILVATLVFFQAANDVNAYEQLYKQRCQMEFLNRTKQHGHHEVAKKVPIVKSNTAVEEDDEEDDDDDDALTHIVAAAKKKRKEKRYNLAQKMRNKYDYEDDEDLVDANGPVVITHDDIRKDIEDEFRDFDDPQNVFSIKSVLLNCFFTIVRRSI